MNCYRLNQQGFVPVDENPVTTANDVLNIEHRGRVTLCSPMRSATAENLMSLDTCTSRLLTLT